LSADNLHEEQRSPFAELAVIYQRLQDLGMAQTVDGSMVKDLLDAANRREALYHTAAEMQLPDTRLGLRRG
jgi:hypothetical protein